VEKLGIKPGTRLAAINAPADLDSTLGTLPENASCREGFFPQMDLVICFVQSLKELKI